jgi:CheY-like chemotaxis protein
MTHICLTQEVLRTIKYNFWKKHSAQPSSEVACQELIALLNGAQHGKVPAETLYPVYLKNYDSRMDTQHMEVLAMYFGYDCWQKWIEENNRVITAVIVDDEAPSRENLEAILKIFCDKVMVIAKATSLSEARQVIEEMSPDLVLLDIHMGTESGLDLLQSLPDTGIEVMFVTAYKDYNAKSLLERPYEYILKPVDLDMLNDAIERVRIRVFD